MDACYINISNKKSKIEKTEKFIGPVDFALYELERTRSFKEDIYDSKIPFCFGIGPMAGGILPGFNRLIFCTRSPQMGCFFMSTIGGAGIALEKTGINFVSITGKSKNPVILKIKNNSVSFEEIKKEELSKIYEKQGQRSFSDYLLEKYKNEYKDMYFRIMTVGPSAFTTDMAGINSILIKNGEFDLGAEGWAGRGGFGSKMARAHNICAIIFGGDKNIELPKKLKEIKLIEEEFRTLYNMGMGEKINSATEKYRYSEKLKTGGTHGVNFETLGSWLPMFNWQSIYLSTEERKSIYTNLVKNNYLKQFNEQTIKTKKWKNCGEACTAMCKKINNGREKDYEPFESCGPNCGIFNQDSAEKLEFFVSDMGYCAIEFGNLISFVFECIEKKLLFKEDVGIKTMPVIEPRKYTLKCSSINAEAGVELTKNITYGKTKVCQILQKGIRTACKELEVMFLDRTEERKVHFVDLANYIPFGISGSIAPSEYWMPGFYVPLPIQGKFFTHYSQDFMTPRELGRKSAERTIYEMFSENTGICRFHRGWTENLLPRLLEIRFKRKIDYFQHCKTLMQKILDYDKKSMSTPVIWESKRTKDILRKYIEECVNVFGGNDESEEWNQKMKLFPDKAIEEYWNELLKGINEILKW